ncbi:MAG: efflux RND transporter periplasmic adaptor subunit [Arcobacteraceae bacterium]|nr:transporter [Arcobacteraceae bacterium]
MIRVFLAILIATSLYGDIYATYEVKAKYESSLNMDSSGIVKDIFVDIGDSVTKNQTLLRLDDSEEEAIYENSKLEYEFLLSQYQRYKSSKDAFDINTLEKLSIDLQQTKNQIIIQKSKLNKKSLLSPYDGVIAQKYIELGDKVTGDNKPLFVLLSHQKKLIIKVDSSYITKIKLEDKFCFDEGTRCVSIAKIYPSIDPKTQKLSLEAYDDGLVVGSFGEGYIKIK